MEREGGRLGLQKAKKGGKGVEVKVQARTF